MNLKWGKSVFPQSAKDPAQGGAHGLGQVNLTRDDSSHGRGRGESCGGPYQGKVSRGAWIQIHTEECEAGGAVGRRLARIPPAFWEV